MFCGVIQHSASTMVKHNVHPDQAIERKKEYRVLTHDNMTSHCIQIQPKVLQLNLKAAGH